MGKALLENGSADREADTLSNGLPIEREGFENEKAVGAHESGRRRATRRGKR